MVKMPRNRDEWIIAVASALAGFFYGGAAIAATQRFLRKWFGVGR